MSPNDAQPAKDSSGWTMLQPSADSRVVYVSNNGSDTNSGLSQDSPKKTIKEAVKLLRRGFPDWLMLERGSTFQEDRVSFSASGRSAAEKAVVTSYGSGARPVLQATGFLYWWHNGSPEFSLNHVAVTGLDFVGPWANSAILFAGAQHDILFEDNRFRNVRVGIQIQHQVSHPRAPGVMFPHSAGFVIRRNAFVDCFGLCGLHMSHCRNVVIEDNLFDNCGQPEPTIKKHNIYLQQIQGLSVSSNYLLRGSNMGLKCSSDTVEGFTDFEITGNYFFNNALSLDHSRGITHDPAVEHSHARGLVAGNVFHESARLFGTQRQDLAMWLLNSRDITYDGNHFVHKTLWNGNPMITWGEKQDRITFRNNLVYDWKMPESRPATHYFVGNWNQNVTNGIHENNIVAKDGRVFLDPERTVIAYIGQDDIQGVSDVLWNRTKDNWSDLLGTKAAVDYVVAGFEVVNPNPDGEPEPEPDETILVSKSELARLIASVEGVVADLKRIAGIK